MNKHDTASAVVSEQFKRMIEQERKSCEIFFSDESQIESLPLSKEKLSEVLLRNAAMMRIMSTAELN